MLAEAKWPHPPGAGDRCSYRGSCPSCSWETASATIADWIAEVSPSSQPTSSAWATRSSPADGGSPQPPPSRCPVRWRRHGSNQPAHPGIGRHRVPPRLQVRQRGDGGRGVQEAAAANELLQAAGLVKVTEDTLFR